MSFNLGLCNQKYKDEVFKLLNLYGYSTEKLPSIVENSLQTKEKLISAMKQDKKNDASGISFILQKSINETEIQTVEEKEILLVL